MRLLRRRDDGCVYPWSAAIEATGAFDPIPQVEADWIIECNKARAAGREMPPRPNATVEPSAPPAPPAAGDTSKEKTEEAAPSANTNTERSNKRKIKWLSEASQELSKPPAEN